MNRLVIRILVWSFMVSMTLIYAGSVAMSVYILPDFISFDTSRVQIPHCPLPPSGSE